MKDLSPPLGFHLVILLSFVFQQTSSSQSCVTVITDGGSGGGERCALPFRFRGKLYSSCTTDFDPNGKLWCSTLVDKSGNHIINENKWGHCDVATCLKPGKKCVTVGGRDVNKQCVFPFHHKGVTYNKCTLDFADDNIPWCSTSTESTGGHIIGSWGHCNCNDGNQCCSSASLTNGTTEGNVADENSGKFLPGIDKCSRENGLSFETPLPDDVFAFVGGEEASIFSTPYMALMGSKRKSGGDGKIRYGCGGSLINKKYVLSAAHCFTNKMLETVEVVLGEFDVTKDPDCSIYDEGICAEKVQKIPVEMTILHKGYTGKRNHLHDIALVRLAQPARYSSSVQPVCLPLDTALISRILQTPDIVQGLDSKVSYGMGWGRTSFDSNGDFDKKGVSSTKLQWGRLSFVSNAVCKEKLGAIFGPRSGNIVEETQVCSGDEFRDTCNGDSGGPLMAPGIGAGLGESLIQIGIVSFGSPFCGDGNPAVYTRVSAYIDWIKENLKD